MPLDNEDIRKVTEYVWSATLGMDLISTDKLPQIRKQEFLTGCVYIVGGWEGLATIQCSERLARKAASIMFACSEPPTAEVRDALGELVNMTGGNIKSLLPGPCELSLPSIIEGKDHYLTVPGSELANQVFFEFEGEPLEVLLLRGKLSRRAMTNLETELR